MTTKKGYATNLSKGLSLHIGTVGMVNYAVFPFIFVNANVPWHHAACIYFIYFNTKDLSF
jgi:hypothetical protein